MSSNFTVSYFIKENTKLEERRVKTYDQSKVLHNCQFDQDTASVCQHCYITPSTPEQRNPEGQNAESSLKN